MFIAMHIRRFVTFLFLKKESNPRLTDASRAGKKFKNERIAQAIFDFSICLRESPSSISARPFVGLIKLQ
jgi:hypothetical protein